MNHYELRRKFLDMLIDIRGKSEEVIQRLVASGRYETPAEAVEALLEKCAETEMPEPAAEPRKGGQWRGRVQIAEDFDELPAELHESFGMDD